MRSRAESFFQGRRRHRLLALSLSLGAILFLEFLIRWTGWGLPRGGTLAQWDPRGLPLFTCRRPDQGGGRVCRTSKYYQGGVLPEEFPREKPKSAVRIFCVGDSITVGYPYFQPGAFPSLLKNLLEWVDPFARYEVINAGAVGWTSAEAAQISAEVLAFHPDYLVIYIGDNDYLSTDPALERKGLAPVFEAIRGAANHSMICKAVVALVNRWTAGPQDFSSLSGTEAIKQKARTFRGQILDRGWDQATKEKVRSRFREHLLAIVRAAKARGAVPLLCTVPVNLREYPPFDPTTDLPVPPPCRLQPETLTLDHADPEWKSRCDALLNHPEPAPDNAAQSYSAGCCLLDRNDWDTARRKLEAAVEMDPCPNRATPSMNRILREISLSEQVPLVDLDRIFQQVSPGGAPGDEMFLDPSHPVLAGQQLIALSVLEVLMAQRGQSLGPDFLETAQRQFQIYHAKIPTASFANVYYIAALQSAGTGHFLRAKRLCQMALSADPHSQPALALQKSLQEIMGE